MGCNDTFRSDSLQSSENRTASNGTNGGNAAAAVSILLDVPPVENDSMPPTNTVNNHRHHTMPLGPIRRRMAPPESHPLDDPISTMNVNMDQEERDIWARSEGYTPLLADFQGTMMMMTMGPDDDDDDDEEEDDEVERGFRSGGGGGAFFVDFTAFGSAAVAYQDDDEDDNDENNIQKGNFSTGHCEPNDSRQTDQQDYRTVAEMALSSLEEEYSRTLMFNQSTTTEHVDITANVNELTKSTDPTDASLASTTPTTMTVPILDGGNDDKHGGTAAKKSESLTSSKSSLLKRVIPSIDTDAVRRAVQAISLRDPKLASNMNKWQEELQQRPTPVTPKTTTAVAPPVHAIVPKLSLQAFRKRTAKAIQATANLTRSATLAEGLYRVLLWKSESSDPTAATTTTEPAPTLSMVACGKLVVHVVGVDHVECSSPQQTRLCFGPLVRWLGAAANALVPREIELHLVGPNIPLTATTESAIIDLMPTTTTTTPQGKRCRLQSAVAMYHRAKYHDWWLAHQESKEHSTPHLIVCYNAGIWGYEEWRPTLQLLCNMPFFVPFIATAYTLQEAEDDWDVIRDVIMAANKNDDGTVEDRCLWNVEANPFASKLPRPTATAVPGREYRENAAWQAWRLGQGHGPTV